MTFFYIMTRTQESEIFPRDPVTIRDWLNLAQTAAVMVLWLVL
jgi:hypothetical protein